VRESTHVLSGEGVLPVDSAQVDLAHHIALLRRLIVSRDEARARLSCSLESEAIEVSLPCNVDLAGALAGTGYVFSAHHNHWVEVLRVVDMLVRLVSGKALSV